MKSSNVLFLVSLLGHLLPLPAHAIEVFNLNVFDQLQGEWDAGFRARRMAVVAHYVKTQKPDLVVFQEAQGEKKDSPDAAALRRLYPFRSYVHEMTGADGASYGYWMGSKRRPLQWIEDGFFFPGGVDRRVQGALLSIKGRCLGVVSLHLSYQNSEVRVKEAEWLLGWLKKREAICPRWLVLGDFNAEGKSPEMQALFSGGLKSLYREEKPTVGAFNPIRRIYGENTPSRTIDWALGWNLEGEAEVVLDHPYEGEWVSDHAGVRLKVVEGRVR